jgi:phosphoribosyl 1,2-cyclic phosphate phosphodiesterase
VKVEILGSAGAAPTPRPGCTCSVCVEARQRGAPYARTGPSLFLHGPDLLFDTPEESRMQLERAGIASIAGCFYSHWHPDHTMGRRLWETLNLDLRTWPPEAKRRVETPIYLPEQVARDFRTYLGLWDHFAFMAEHGWVRIVELADGDTVEAGGWTVRPFRLAEDYVYAFLLERDGRRVLLAPDETNGWSPPEEVRGVDVAVLPMGICEHDPLTGERRLHPEHPVLRFEATFDETLGIVRELGAGRTVLSHVEEMDGLSYDDLLELERRLDGLVEFAYDGLVLDVG